MDVALVLFTRDLRVRDNPALARACARARAVPPLFAVGPALAGPVTARPADRGLTPQAPA